MSLKSVVYYVEQTTATVTSTQIGTVVITERGVLLNTSPSFSLANRVWYETGVFPSTCVFNSYLSGLLPATNYYLQAYVKTALGSYIYGEVTGFTTLSTGVVAPTLTTTSPAANITGVSASVTGAITDVGNEYCSSRGICYNTGGAPTIADSTVGEVGYKSFPIGSFTKSLTGLTPGTTYHCRAYAQNSAGVAYGSEVDFTTDDVPVVTTDAITAIAGTTATGGGEVTDEGGDDVTARGVCWNTTGSPTTADSKTEDGAGDGVFVSSLAGLTKNVLYYVRAYATNSIGTAYGPEVTFTTISTPIVTTFSPATRITATTARVEAEIVSTGGVDCTARGICWNTTGSPTTADSKAEDAGTFAAAPFKKSATGLTAKTLYYVRAYATNTEGTSYGSTITFTTLSVSVSDEPQVTLNDTYFLKRAGRYSDPLNSNDRLPLVYGDLTDGSLGNWVLPCIDDDGGGMNPVYCFAGHEVLSAANGNSITIYENDLELNSALYTFSEADDFESEGIIATITFSSPKTGSVITARGKGKPTVSGGATLMTNIIDIVDDFLTVENNFTASLFEATYKATSRDRFLTQGYEAAGAIKEDVVFWAAIQNMMASFLGSAYLNGSGELVLEIDDGTFQEQAFAGFMQSADVDFESAVQRFENLINQCPASYGYDYAKGEFKYSTDTEAHADAISQSIYGIRKPAEPYPFYWCRDLTSIQAIQDIIVAKFKDPVWEIEVSDNTLKRMDSDVGRLVAYSAKNLFGADGVALLNHVWRILSYKPDFVNAKIAFKLLQTAYYWMLAYLADGTYKADGSILAGNNRDVTM